MKDKEWSKRKLQAFVKDIVTKMMEGTLDYVEVSIGNQERYKILRSKLLRLGNDALRSITAEVDNNYDVTFLGISNDIVKVSARFDKQSKQQERKGKNG